MKVTEAQFWNILAKNYGLYSRTARAIEKEFNCTMHRSSVKERAEKHPERLQDIEEEGYDSMEGGFKELMEDDDKRIKLDAIKSYAKFKGKKRGYVEKQEVDTTHNFPKSIDINFT